LLRVADRRDRRRRDGRLRGLPVLGLRSHARGAGARLRAHAGAGSAGRARATALVGLDGGARRDDRRERLLPDDAVLLLLRVPRAGDRGAGRVRAGPFRLARRGAPAAQYCAMTSAAGPSATIRPWSRWRARSHVFATVSRSCVTSTIVLPSCL